MNSDAELLRRALAVSTVRFEERMLESSRACRKWDRNARVETLDRLRGEVAARIATYDTSKHPEEVLREESVTVRDVTEKKPFFYPYVAIYDERDRTVDVNVSLISAVEAYLKTVGAPELTDPGLLRRLAMAHELSHHLDWMDRPRSPSLRDRITGAADIANTLSEIKAVMLSRAWVGYSWSPSVIELAIHLTQGDRATVEETLAALGA